MAYFFIYISCQRVIHITLYSIDRPAWEMSASAGMLLQVGGNITSWCAYVESVRAQGSSSGVYQESDVLFYEKPIRQGFHALC